MTTPVPTPVTIPPGTRNPYSRVTANAARNVSADGEDDVVAGPRHDLADEERQADPDEDRATHPRAVALPAEDRQRHSGGPAGPGGIRTGSGPSAGEAWSVRPWAQSTPAGAAAEGSLSRPAAGPDAQSHSSGRRRMTARTGLPESESARADSRPSVVAGAPVRAGGRLGRRRLDPQPQPAPDAGQVRAPSGRGRRSRRCPGRGPRRGGRAPRRRSPARRRPCRRASGSGGGPAAGA